MDEVTMPKAAFDALMQQISTLQATVVQLNAIIEEKDQIILNHNRARFGQSSEKRTYLLADGQLSMFEQAGDGITEKSADEANSKQKAVSVTAPQFGKSAWPIGTSTGSTNGRNTSEPMTFESVCARAVRRASAVPPMAASQAVIVVPTFAPSRTEIAIS